MASKPADRTGCTVAGNHINDRDGESALSETKMAASAGLSSAACQFSAASLRYANKVMLAPMVRVGTLPSRLLALRHGADLVYGEELIDFKMIKCRRVENPVLGSVDFVLPDNSVVFRTCAEERDRVVFQMGTSDPQRAVKVTQLVADDVAGIDINMGCPKPFSIKGGMGAALLKHPERVRAILSALVKNVDKPITCKIRLLPSLEESLHLAKVIESTGVAAVGVHGRRQEQRPREPVTMDQCEEVRAIAEALSIPVIANGGSLDIKTRKDAVDFQNSCGCSSVMVARSAQWNMSMFRPEGPLEVEEVAKQYLELAIKWDNQLGNTKFCLLQTLHTRMTTPLGKGVQAAHSMEELAGLFGLSEYYAETVAKRASDAARLGFDLLQTDDQIDEGSGTHLAADKIGVVVKRSGDAMIPAAKRQKSSHHPDGAVVVDAKYGKRLFLPNSLPKLVLNKLVHSKAVEKPSFRSVEVPEDRRFLGICSIGDKDYCTLEMQKNKREAEQAAALAALIHMKRMSFSTEKNKWLEVAPADKT